jgi:hypothetical protein
MPKSKLMNMMNETAKENSDENKLTTTANLLAAPTSEIDYSKYSNLPVEPSPSEGVIVSAQNAPLIEGERMPKPKLDISPSKIFVEDQIVVNDNTLTTITPNCTMKIKIGLDWYSFESMQPMKVSRMVRDVLMGANALYLGGTR